LFIVLLARGILTISLFVLGLSFNLHRGGVDLRVDRALGAGLVGERQAGWEKVLSIMPPFSDTAGKNSPAAINDG